jgi:hypothetical protein
MSRDGLDGTGTSRKLMQKIDSILQFASNIKLENIIQDVSRQKEQSVITTLNYQFQKNMDSEDIIITFFHEDVDRFTFDCIGH